MNQTVPSSAAAVWLRIAGDLATVGLHLFTFLLAFLALVRIVPQYFALFEHYELFDQRAVEMSNSTELLIAVVFFDVAMASLLSFFAARRRWLLTLYSSCWLLAIIFFLFMALLVLGVQVGILTKT